MAIEVSKKNPIPAFDSVTVTYPTTASEVYTYKKGSVTVATATVTYSDATKLSLSTFIRTWDV